MQVVWVPAVSNQTVSCDAGCRPIRTQAVTVLDRSHEVSEGVEKLRDLQPTLVLGERSCGLQSRVELVGALSELSRRLGVKHGAALLR